MYRDTIYAGLINNGDLNKNVHFYGWVKNIRKLGSLIFMDVIDRYGYVQVVVDDKNKYFDEVYHTPIQSVVYVEGKVNKRKSPNNKIKNGDIEVLLTKFELNSKAETLPISVDDDSNAGENIRLKYRYLDLRRPCNQKNLVFRSKLIHTIRCFFQKNGFCEIETPCMSKATPEGARDYLVPTRNEPNSFYALPQSPQIYKQLLMVSGMLKYFQIARCFRDEDLRADRQPEFTQLDVEMSFIEEKDIQGIIEKLMVCLFKDNMGIDLKTPFIRINYEDAMNKYGCDKPDLRFDLFLHDASKYFAKTNFKVFANTLKEKNAIKYIICDKLFNKEQIETLKKYAKDNKAFDLISLSLENNEVKGQLHKVIENETIKQIFKDHKIKEGTILLIAGHIDVVNQALGAVRNVVGDMLNLKDPNKYCFAWIVNWPLYEYDEEHKRYAAAHHPFTSPTLECLKTFDKDYKNAKARAYDIVLNGYEIGGGSIRINNPEIQNRMFHAIGLSDADIKKKFGFMINAFKYGVPIHGGIALGLDRFIMLLTHTQTIRDIIAFPKDSHNYDQMMESPTSVSEEQLDEVHLKIKK